MFPDVERKPPCFPCLWCPVTGHHWKHPGSIFFVHSLQVFIHIDKIFLSLLFSRWNHVRSLSLSLQERNPSPLIILEAPWWNLQYTQGSCNEEPRTGYDAPGVASSATNHMLKKILQWKNIMGGLLKILKLYLHFRMTSEWRRELFSRSMQVKILCERRLALLMDSLAEHVVFFLCSCVTYLIFLPADIAAQQELKGRWKLPVCAVLELLK